MSLRIIGPGFGRTGTKSLKLALEELGFGPCHHMHEVRDNPAQLPAWEAAAQGRQCDWDQMFDGYSSQVDWPGARYWRELVRHFPDAQVILTVRDPDLWYDSMSKTIIPFIEAAGSHPADHPNRIAAWGEKALNRELFAGKLGKRDDAIKVYLEHTKEVQEELPASRLLTFDVSGGWQPLCTFLRVPMPDRPFPHVNSTRGFNTVEWKDVS